MDAKRVWTVLVGLLWAVATVLPPGVHAADSINGGTTQTDVCRQDEHLYAIACGAWSDAGLHDIVVGLEAKAYSHSDIVIGPFAGAEKAHSISIGSRVYEDGTNWFTYTDGDGAIAVGAGAHVFNHGSISLGMRAVANGARSVVLGDRSTDDGLSGVVSFGNQDFQRDLIYVKNITSSGVMSANGFVASGDMEVETATVRNALVVSAGGASITGGINANNAKVVGVAAGEISATSLEAVNGSQLYQTQLAVQAAREDARAAQTEAQAAKIKADAAQTEALAAKVDAQAALAGLQDIVNQLLQTGVCNLSGGTFDCSTNLQLAGGTVGAGANHAIAIGDGASALSSGGIAMGQNARAVQSNSIAIGAGATAFSSVAVGTGAAASGTNSTAVGDDALASGDYAVAIGSGAQATHANSVAIGSGSTTQAPGTVSVGAPGSERRITNVAPGVSGTDAVNVDQLYAAISGLDRASRAYVDERIEALRLEIARGIAAAAAMINVQPSTVGKTAVGVGVGHYDGQTAFGLSVVRAPKEGVLLSLGAAAAMGSNPVVQAGVSFEF